MAIDRSKIAFYSDDPIDKIVMRGQVTVTNAGSQPVTDGLGNVNYPDLRAATTTIANTYGRAVMVRYRWSIDGGTTWNGQDSNMFYGYNVDARFNGVSQGSQPTTSLRGIVAVGSTNSQITFRTVSNYHTTAGIFANTVSPSFNINWGGWSSISQTFTIQYWAYERE